MLRHWRCKQSHAVYQVIAIASFERILSLLTDFSLFAKY